MKASEILRKMADLIDAKETGSQGTEITNRPEVVGVEQPTDAQGIEGQAQVNTVAMVSPLQQKLELLKKAAGVDSAFATGALSTDASADKKCCDEPSNELEVIKKNAGIPVAIQLGTEDNDITG